ncbi:putative tetratricopeptide-like helical domain-containing protein [Rosa chinensis]|uniref:Putative tetratricopeptide-like helical domain-containing protein n=1 Tax=Rosa chinensis TaxID=74649 RepID=A0A2P6QRI7_ROSCH|nr:uncharacterized protein LOC112197123 [Rosa chinensis]PRQ36792.1 putative tetratricopeptide-like helical domain-containing protein [Rosa chinensis]
MEELKSSVTPTQSLDDQNDSMLQTAPSLSIFNSDVDEFRESNQQLLERTITIEDRIGGTRDFRFGDKSMGFIKEEGEEEEEDQVQPPSPPMYLATGLGFDTGGFGFDGGDDFPMPEIDENGNPEEYYKKMVDEYPCHPLFLRNYAQVLQSKGDLHGAEDYYFRSTQANPEDGEVLVQYAKLVWQLRHDQDRALSYFERAAQASPDDSHVLAAYASFLWEIDDDLEEDEAGQDQIQVNNGQNMNKLENKDTNEEIIRGHISTGNEIDDEENYKTRIQENPKNALLLRNYAEFLCQTKGDLHSAEEYYLRATVADPNDGEILAQYAQLVWELHHDSKKATSYFERAVEATAEDSYVLGAYAHFLWENEEDD